MKAVLCTRYGPPEVLQLAEIDRPRINDNQVLIRIAATAVNSGDVRVRGLVVQGFLRLVMRVVLGFSKPRKPVLGNVLSGTVEAVGAAATAFRPGDEVFACTGFGFGAYAQYIALPANGTIARKPTNASFEEAAALLFGGTTALYFLQKAGLDRQPGAQVLIFGATGSVGTAAVQLAKHYGATVTAVCSSEGAELARRLGSDAVVDYRQQDVTRLPGQFDVIFDAVGHYPKKEYRHLLARGGRYMTVGGLDVAKETRAQLEQLKQLFEAGQLQAVIDRSYPLEQIEDAHRYVDTGRKKGNVVVRVDA